MPPGGRGCREALRIARPPRDDRPCGFDFAAFREATWTLIAANVRATLAARAAAIGKALEEADVEPLTWTTAERGLKCTAADYAAAVTTIHRTGRAVARFFTGYDILLTATMCSPPWPLGVLSLSNPDHDAYFVAINGSIGFTSLFNAAGNPAMSVPLHWTRRAYRWACSRGVLRRRGDPVPARGATRDRQAMEGPASSAHRVTPCWWRAW